MVWFGSKTIFEQNIFCIKREFSVQLYNMDKYLIVAILSVIVSRIDSARILAVIPVPSISHQVVFRPLTQELVKRGHEVVVITTDPAYPPGEAPANLTEIDVGNVSYATWQKSFIKADVGKRNDIYKQVTVFVKDFTTIFEDQIQTKPFEEIAKNKNNGTFDLLILEMCARPALAISHVYKAPVILMTTNAPLFGINKNIGLPTNPLLYPVIPRQRLYNLNYWEKVKEVLRYFYLEYIYDLFEHGENEVLRRHFDPDIPRLSEMYNNVDMYFHNTYSLFMDNPPLSPNVIYMGGLHQTPTKELPQDLSLYLNSSKNGVIYVSFGTNVKTCLLMPEKVQMMIKVFSSLSYDVLWKMDTKELAGISKNIKVAKWLPQADLLKHPKIKAFITQGGLQSTDEAIDAGAPLIGIPIFTDQWYNVEKYVRNKFGIKLDWYSLTAEEFRTAILTVAEDESYRENIRRFRSLINDHYASSLERAVSWTEYVLRHGGAKHLRAPAANMSWAEYYELDLVIIIVISLIFALYLILLLLYSIWLRLFKIIKSYV